MTSGAAEMQSSAMDLPGDISLPFFTYGLLKPSMPAFGMLKPYLANEPVLDIVRGELFARDGLPLLHLNGSLPVRGYRMHWCDDAFAEAYEAVGRFEPRKHYTWKQVILESGQEANVLVDRFPTKGNPQPLDDPSQWRITDDPAFGEGLATVADTIAELDNTDSQWKRFFKAQMAYLLLWSILERLSALCIGPAKDPTIRVHQLHALPGMKELLVKHVHRSDKVADSRDPSQSYKLDAEEPQKCFKYYYQVRSNLSHRGKGVYNEIDKVEGSARELLAITTDYLSMLGAV